ncbi:hypothetical protein AA80_09745 [Petrotoga sibirica DSM 13575]|uniref:Uncharacterized protein n=1 Tax=Petrotoga sibirica DSM 13575 TaxID=1122956 RepID=A0A855MIH6_9BACT|nr:hypothetical protein AA80_09745 [Petrotoga sibirica DSM 13575]POZ90429.1 hypothetical protein AD60_07080 [Petrotoga sp. SL27]
MLLAISVRAKAVLPLVTVPLFFAFSKSFGMASLTLSGNFWATLPIILQASHFTLGALSMI